VKDGVVVGIVDGEIVDAIKGYCVGEDKLGTPDGTIDGIADGGKDGTVDGIIVCLIEGI
jgi:hypothetical protein